MCSHPGRKLHRSIGTQLKTTQASIFLLYAGPSPCVPCFLPLFPAPPFRLLPLPKSRENNTTGGAAHQKGKGLERHLPPRDRNAALNSMKPLLREGDWDAAVLLALDEIHRRLATNLSKASGGGQDSGAMSVFGQGWSDFKQRVMGGWDGGGGGGGRGGGGGGAGGGGGIFDDFFGRHWPQEVSPGSALLVLSLLWGGAAARRASVQRRRYNKFEAKLAGIEAQR